MKRTEYPSHTVRGLPLFDAVMTAPVGLSAPSTVSRPPSDTTAGRHRGAPDSVLAEQRTGSAVRTEQRRRVWEAILAAGADGLTVDELAVKWDTTPNRISGRFTELVASEVILPAGRRRTRTGNTATAWKAARFALGAEQRTEDGRQKTA